jgi:hypothetical protein
VKASDTVDVLVIVAVPTVGACGTVVAVIEDVAEEAGEEPEVLVAFAVKV